MKDYIRNWNLMRIFRLVLGIFIIVQGTLGQEWLLVGFGSLFSLMPLFNIGCCGVSGCYIPAPKSDQKTEDIMYEEIK